MWGVTLNICGGGGGVTLNICGGVTLITIAAIEAKEKGENN